MDVWHMLVGRMKKLKVLKRREALNFIRVINYPVHLLCFLQLWIYTMTTVIKGQKGGE